MNDTSLPEKLHSTCPICKLPEGGKSLKILIKDIWKNPHYVHHCKICNLYYLECKPEPSDLLIFYQHEYYFKSKVLDAIKKRFRLARCKSQFEYIQEKCTNGFQSVIEIGAGDGMLLSFFKNSNKSVMGTELSKKYQLVDQITYGINLTGKDFYMLEEKCNLLIMSHVFEHFIDFYEVYKKANELIERDGYFFIEIPNSPKLNEVSELLLNEYLQSSHIHNFDYENIIKTIPSNFNLISIDRYNYNIKFTNNKNQGIEISRTLLDGKFSSKNLFQIIGNFILVLVNPKNFYKRVSLKSQWLGYGDNIRIILQKK